MFPPFADLLADLASESGKKIVVTVVVSALTTAAGFLFGRWWGRYKATREWKSKEFLDRVIVSLNILADDTLKIRTVLERSIEQVFLNPIAIEKVQRAAKACTVADPLLHIAKADRWYVLNYVLNAVAEHFAAGQVKQDAGVPVAVVRYALFLTCEVVGDERIRKVRAMLVRREHLESFAYADAMPTLENQWHDVRVLTLRRAAALFRTEPDLFLTLEVCV